MCKTKTLYHKDPHENTTKQELSKFLSQSVVGVKENYTMKKELNDSKLTEIILITDYKDPNC